MIKIGIIGAGPNAAEHARYYHASNRTSVAWVADPDEQRANALATECSALAIPDFRDGLQTADAVVISSPNYLHHDHAVACAQAGKHIYCEKPMGLSLTEAHSIADAVQAAGVRSQIGFAVRFGGDVQLMLRKAREGDLGDIVAVTSRRLMSMNGVPSTNWRLNPKLSGGLVLEINIHEIEWMMALGGDVKSVYARTWAADNSDPRANDHIWVTLGFTEGATGMHEGSWSSPNTQFFRSVAGTKAGLSTDEWGGSLYYAQLGTDRENIVPDPPFDLRGNFLDAIDRGTPTVANVDWGLKVMTVAEAIYESASSGQVVTLGQEKQ